MKLFDASDQVPLHNLDMVNVEEDFHAFGPDLFADFDGHFDLVAEIIRMAFHLDVHPRVEHFEAEVDFFLFRMANNLFQALDHVVHPRFIRDAAAEAREGYDAGKAGFG